MITPMQKELIQVIRFIWIIPMSYLIINRKKLTKAKLIIPIVAIMVSFGTLVGTRNIYGIRGNIESKIYHEKECEIGQMIKKSNEIWIRDKVAASENDYRPCKNCCR